MKVYNKLVRDKIPEIIAADGKKANTRVLDNKEYRKELIKKLQEEAKELAENPSVEELADIKELLIAIRGSLKFHAGTLEDERRKKATERGRFKNKIFLESVEE